MLTRSGPGVVGQNVEWSSIARHVFRVLSLEKHATVDADGKVQRASRFRVYGHLIIESPIMATLRPGSMLPESPISLPIIHNHDFRVAASILDEPRMRAALDRREVELLVTYAPKRIGPRGLSMSDEHVLFFAGSAPGALERYYEREGASARDPERFFGPFVYMGEVVALLTFEEHPRSS